MNLQTVEKQLLDAALGFGTWEDAVATISAFVGGNKAMLLGASSDACYATSVFHNHDPGEVALYNSGYNRLDPRRYESMRTPVGEVRLGQEYVSNDSIRKTAYFADISLRGDVKDSVHGVISNDEFGRFTISVQRGFSDEYFGSAEAERLAAVLPLLAKGFARSRAITTVRSAPDHNQRLQSYLVATDLRFRSLGKSGQPNLDFLPSGISAGPSGFQFDTPALETAFKQGIMLAKRTGDASFRLNGHILRFAQIPPQLGWSELPGMEAILTIYRAQASNELAIYAKAFGFTPRETETLQALVAEGAPRKAAERLGVSYETVRWHIKNMQSKSGSSSFQAMIRFANSGDLSELT